MKVHFALPSKSQVIVSITADYKETTQNVIKKFIGEAKKQIDVDIKRNQIKQFRINQQVDNILKEDKIL